MNSNNPAKQEDFVFDKYVAIALVVGLVAGFIIGNSVGGSRDGENALVYNGNATSTATTTSASINGIGSAEVGGDWLVVPDQEEGNNVVISKLTLDKSYWVAIRDNEESVENAFVLGARKIFPGTYTDLSIYANRPTVSGNKYDIVFYNDNGGEFDYSDANLVKNDSEMLRATFNVR